MAAQDAQNEQLRKAVERALAASFVARRAKADVAKDLLNKDRPPTADDIRQALEDGGWAKELRAISASRRVEAPSLPQYDSCRGRRGAFMKMATSPRRDAGPRRGRAEGPHPS